MLETEQFSETVFAEEGQGELTPLDQFRQQWIQQPGPIPLIKQKNVIDQNPELLPYAGMAGLQGWSRPFAFAMQGLVIAALVLSLLNWYMSRDKGQLHDEMVTLQENMQSEVQRQQEIMDATQAEIKGLSHSRSETFILKMSDHALSRGEALQQLNASLDDTSKSLEQFKVRTEARGKELASRQSALAIAYSGSPVVFTLALVFAAGGVRRSIQRSYSRNRNARNSGDYYLYFATAEGMYLNLVLLFFLHFALSGASYGLADLFQGVGPLFWGIFWAGFYFLLLWFFVTVARDMYKVLELRPPAAEWGPQNRMLLRIHNSFFLVLLELEIPFLAACYLLYRAR